MVEYGGLATSPVSSSGTPARKNGSERESSEVEMRLAGARGGVQAEMLGLTGGVAVDVRPPRVVHASAGRRLTKLNCTIQSSSVVSEP